MKRREFITLVGGAAAWPWAARAQQAGKLPTIGFLGTDAATWSPWTETFVSRLRTLGWIEGRTIAIEYRWDQARPERDDEIAAEFVRLKVDVIATVGSAVPRLKRATSDIPIVFAIADDPVGRGFVASLSRPGGNVTGLSLQAADAATKRLELLREAIPHLRQLAVMADVDDPQRVLEMRAVEAAARAVGLEVASPLVIRRAEDIAAVFSPLNLQIGALYVVGDALMIANRTRIGAFALGARLPTMFNAREYAQSGGLMSYGPSFPALFRRAAEMVDKILRGTKPADIPIEQPTIFELVVNLTTAKAIGLTVPESFLLRSDELIE
jgi:putative ABC transport system substrate-binding protein